MEPDMPQNSTETQPLLQQQPSSPTRPPEPGLVERVCASLWSSTFVVFLIATAVIAFSGPLMGDPLVRMYRDIVCCEKVGDEKTCGGNATQCASDGNPTKCVANATLCAGNATQSELSHINNWMTVSTAVFEFVALGCWSSLALIFPLNRWSVLLLSQASSWLAEASKAVAAYYLPRNGLSLRWVWAAPVWYLVGGGPTLYVVLRDFAIADAGEDVRTICYAMIQIVATLLASAGGFFASYLMRRCSDWPCLIPGLSVYLGGTMLLLFLRRADTLRAPWEPEQKEDGSPSGGIPIALVLATSIAYNPLSNSISDNIALQYIPARFSVDMSDAPAILAAGRLFGLFGPVLALVRFVPRWGKLGARFDLILAIICLLAATLACVVLAIAPSLVHFRIGICMAYFGTSYTVFTKSVLAARSTERLRFASFTIDQLVQTFGRAVTGAMLDWLFQKGLDLDLLGLPYIFVSVVCLVASACLIRVYFWEDCDEASSRAPGGVSLAEEDSERHDSEGYTATTAGDPHQPEIGGTDPIMGAEDPLYSLGSASGLAKATYLDAGFHERCKAAE